MATTASRLGRRPEQQNRLIFIGAIVLALIAAVLVFASLSGVTDGGNDGNGGTFAGAVDVVVASQEISAGTRITGDMLTIATLPSAATVEGALTTRDGLEGLVVRQNMTRGDQFTTAKVGLELGNEDKTLSAIVPSGMRAVAVEVDERTTVGGLVVAGDRVDVLVVRESGDVQVATTLLQDIEVLAVAQETLKPVARLDKDGNIIVTDSSGGDLSTRPDVADAQAKAKTVTLSVSPEDAPLVALAQEEGSVWLALRGQGDNEVRPIEPATLDD